MCMTSKNACFTDLPNENEQSLQVRFFYAKIVGKHRQKSRYMTANQLVE